MFYIYRILLFVFITIAALFILKKIRRLGRKRVSQLLLVVVLGYLFSTSLPVEQSFIRFSTPEESFGYSYNQNTLLKTIQKDDFAVALYNNNGKLSYTAINKDKGGWLLCDEVNQVSYDTINQYVVTVVRSYSNKEMVIAMSSVYGNSNNSPLEVHDNIASEFSYDSFEFIQYTCHMAYTVIDTYPSNYEVDMNGASKTLVLK